EGRVRVNLAVGVGFVHGVADVDLDRAICFAGRVQLDVNAVGENPSCVSPVVGSHGSGELQLAADAGGLRSGGHVLTLAVGEAAGEEREQDRNGRQFEQDGR